MFNPQLFLFSAHIYNMVRKSSTQRSAYFYIYFSIVQAEWPDDDNKFETFHQQIIVNLS